jgi:hypothetical protein
MESIDRRRMLRDVLCGAVAATAGLALIREGVEAAPLALDKGLADKTDDRVEKVQAVIGGPRRRRRRWVCWWSRGRRVCGWRWV